MQEVLGQHLEPDPCPVLVLKAQFGLRITTRSDDQGPEYIADLFAIARMDQREEAGADEFLVGVTEKMLRR